MAAIRHTDWEVTKEHERLICKYWPSTSVKQPEAWKSIPGVTARRITETIRAGIWLKPLGSIPRTTYSSVRDVARRTLIVFVSGTTTRMTREATEYEKIRDKIREIFHDRRGTDLNGELYSRVEVVDYDIDDTAKRKYDVDIIVVTSWFREDREYAS